MYSEPCGGRILLWPEEPILKRVCFGGTKVLPVKRTGLCIDCAVIALLFFSIENLCVAMQSQST